MKMLGPQQRQQQQQNPTENKRDTADQTRNVMMEKIWRLKTNKAAL